MYSHRKNVELGPLCIHGHDHGGGKSWRAISNWTCLECTEERIARWASTSVGRESQRKRKLRYAPKSVIRMREYRKESAARIRAYNDEYREKNKDWYLSYYREYNARKRAALRNATPAWTDMDVIKIIYRQAHDLTVATGIKYEVDHIYPLVSDKICGLHVPENLRAIPAKENQSKGNRWWPEDGGTSGYQNRLAYFERAKAALA